MSSNHSPRILFAANLHPEHNFMMQRYESIKSALSNYCIEFMDIFDFFGNHAEALRLESVCFDSEKMRAYFDHADIIELNQQITAQLLSREWSILCLCTMSHYSYFLLPSTIRKISAAGKLVVGFFGDDETMLPQNKYWVNLFDAVVAYSENEVNQYRQWNPYTYLLPITLGKLPTISSVAEQDIDVILVGRPYGKRVEIVRKLKDNGIDVRVYGSNKWRDYKDLDDVYQGFLEQESFWQTLARAKIVLNSTEYKNGKPHLNAKVFEAAMVGTLPIATYYPPFESTYGLENGKNIALYQNMDELLSQIQHYLADNVHRAQVARNLQQHLLEHFSYEKLYRSLFQQLLSQWSSGKTNSVFHKSVDLSRYTIIQFVSDSNDYELAQMMWCKYNNAQIFFVSYGRYKTSCIESFNSFRQSIQARLSDSTREYVVMVPPQTEYDPAFYSLIPLYDSAGFFTDGLYCNSVVRNRRLRKSKYLYDLSSSVWRRQTFVQYASFILLSYFFIGILIQSQLFGLRLSLIPIFLNTISGHRESKMLELYRRLKDTLKRAKSWGDLILERIQFLSHVS